MWKRGRWRERARILWTCFFFSSSTFPPSGDVHHSDGRTRRKTRVKMCVCVCTGKKERASPRIMERKKWKGKRLKATRIDVGKWRGKRKEAQAHTCWKKKLSFYT
jgi:glutathione S-transferase